jgi:large subunit ribosomal protein L24
MSKTEQKQVKLHIKKDDTVQVISGREKGKIGKVLKVDSKSMRVTVEKINLVKRHVKPTQQNPQGGIVEKELPIHYSNVLLVDPSTNKGVRWSKYKKLQAAAPAAKKTAAKKTKAEARK